MKMTVFRFALVAMVAVVQMAFAGGGTLTVIDKAGKEHSLTDWSVQSGYCDISSLPGVKDSLTFSAISTKQAKQIEYAAKAAGQTSVQKDIAMVVPFAQVQTVSITTPGDYQKTGHAEVTLLNGTKEKIDISTLSVEGTENLGELGPSKFSADSARIREIRFPSMAATTGSWRDDKSPATPATVTDRTGKQYRLNNLKTYFTRSNCPYAMHFPCNCGSTGYLSDEFRFKKDQNDVTLTSDKIASIIFDKYDGSWTVKVTLRSGTKYSLSFTPKSSTLVGDLGDRLISIPYDCIKEISLVPSAVTQGMEERKSTTTPRTVP